MRVTKIGHYDIQVTNLELELNETLSGEWEIIKESEYVVIWSSSSSWSLVCSLDGWKKLGLYSFGLISFDRKPTEEDLKDLYEAAIELPTIPKLDNIDTAISFFDKIEKVLK